jgi:hypothetical protein
MAQTKKQKAKVTTKKLFPPRRHPRAPLAVQDRAGLWLDLFVDFTTCIVANREGITAAQAISDAEELADRCLDSFEKRWPTAEVPSRD